MADAHEPRSSPWTGGRSWSPGSTLPGIDVDGLRVRVVELRSRRDGLASLLADGLLSSVAVRQQSVKLTDQISELEADIAAAIGTGPMAQLVDAVDVPAAWDKLDLLGKRQVIRELMKVTILPVGKGARVFDPEKSIAIDWRTTSGPFC